MTSRSSYWLALRVYRKHRTFCSIPSTSHKSSRYDSVSGSALGILGASFGFLASSIALAFAESNQESSKLRQIPKRKSYKYLICGGGAAAQEALKVFIEKDETDDLLLVTPEWRTFEAHDSKESKQELNNDTSRLWMLNSISSFLSNSFTSGKSQSAEILVGPRVTSLDSAKRTATLDNGSEISFDRCILAVGTTMPDIPFGKVVSHDASRLVSGAQSQLDWEHINQAFVNEESMAYNIDTNLRPHVTVVGGGWMSTIVGMKLIERGANVTFSYSEPAFLARYFPRYLSRDLYERFLWESDGGVDSLSYSTIRYVVARNPLNKRGAIEAEVHVGTVFDSFSIIDFRTDRVVFAPTLTAKVPIDAPALVADDGGLLVNPELAAASDIYVAGSAVSVGSGAVKYPAIMRWGVDHAKATGRHAALNCLGARETYSYSPSLTIDLPLVNLTLDIFGNVDGAAESFGYFIRCKEGNDDTSGGQLKKGVLFCVTPAPLLHRGAAQKLLINGIALWHGSKLSRIDDIGSANEECMELLKRDAMNRPELESVMDSFGERILGVKSPTATLQASVNDTDKCLKEDSSQEEVDKHESNMIGVENRNTREDNRYMSPRIVWRRHRPARTVKINQDELLWVVDEWTGNVSPIGKADRMSQAYTDLLRESAGKQ